MQKHFNNAKKAQLFWDDSQWVPRLYFAQCALPLLLFTLTCSHAHYKQTTNGNQNASDTSVVLSLQILYPWPEYLSLLISSHLFVSYQIKVRDNLINYNQMVFVICKWNLSNQIHNSPQKMLNLHCSGCKLLLHGNYSQIETRSNFYPFILITDEVIWPAFDALHFTNTFFVLYF